MLTNMKKRTGLLITLAVMCATVVSVPQTAGAAATVLANTAVGTDYYEAPDNRTILSACPGDSAPAAGFTDTTSTDVDCLKTLGITQGTTATTYEPAGTIPRWQMALFIHRMFVPAGVLAAGLTPVPAFTDISGLSAEIQAAINALASHGITLGTSATTFGPDDNVTREQMAMFLSRFADIALDPAGAAIASTKGTGKFNFQDISGTTFEGMESIIRLYNLGATGETCLVDGSAGDPTGGCAAAFRPFDDITRAEMASMLMGVLNHSNARPAGITIQSTTVNTSVGTVSVLISVRNADGSAQANTSVDEFYQLHNDAAGVAAQSPWTAILNTCSANVTGTGGSKCIIDANDKVTAANGNVLGTNQTSAAFTTANWWVWTGDTGETFIDGTTDNVDTFSVTHGAASTLQAGTSTTITSDAGFALTEDFSGMDDLITVTDGIRTFAGGSRTFTATMAGASATASFLPGYSLKVVTEKVTYNADGNQTEVSTAYHAFDGATASWTVTCPADDSASTTTYAVAFEQTVTVGALLTSGRPTGITTGPLDDDSTPNYDQTTFGTGVGNAGTTNRLGVSCNDTARAYAEGGTGESLSISTNNQVASTAGSMVAVTATAYDQYGAGIAGIETEISSVTSTNATDGSETLRARLTTGAGGTATLSAIVCAGTTTDKVAWSVADADNTPAVSTSEMDVVGASAAGALTAEGTTVYCLAAATDGIYDQATAARHVWTYTTAADPNTADGGTLVINVGGISTITVTCGAATQCGVPALVTAINLIDGVSGMTGAVTSATVSTFTFAAGTGVIGNGVVSAVSTMSIAAGGTQPTEASDVTTTAGADGVTVMFVDDDPSGDYFWANVTTTGDTGTDGASVAEQVYRKFAYDSNDAYKLDSSDGEVATMVDGATQAQFETENASLTGEAGATPMTINYRTGATTSGVSYFVVGS